MKHLIGITCSVSKSQNIINSAYIKAFTTEKTTPLLIPNLFEMQNEIMSEKEKLFLKNQIEVLSEQLDCLVLSGGVDINPTFFKEKIKASSGFNYNRDLMETELIKAFILKNKPIIGICRGFQLLGKLLGLNYFKQDLGFTNEIHSGNHSDVSNRKEQMHEVHLFGQFKDYCIKKGSTEKISINSWHDQGFTLVDSGIRVNNKDIQDFIDESKPFKIKDTNKEELTCLDEEDKEKRINQFDELKIIMSTNKVIEGFEHKTFPIIAFQNHPEEYSESIAINYCIEKLLEKTI